MPEYINLGDVSPNQDRKYVEYQLAAFGGKIIKVRVGTFGDQLALQAYLIKANEDGEKTDISGLVQAAMMLHKEDGSLLFESVEKGVEVLKALPIEQCQALVRAAKVANLLKPLAEGAVVERAKNLEAVS